MTRPSRALPALAGAAALTLGVVSPAGAVEWGAADTVGDVVSYTYDDRTGEETGPDAEPDNTTSDITQFAASHAKRRVELAVGLRDIAAESGFAYYLIRTDDRSYTAIQRLGTDRMFPAFDFSRANGRPAKCDGVRRSVDRTTDVATVSIPRTCLGGPSWVRVGAAAVEFEQTTRRTFTNFVDDALQEGFADDRLGVSPRLQRN